MKKTLQIYTLNHQPISVTLKTLDESYSTQLAVLQETIYNNLINKEIFLPSNEEEIHTYIKDKGAALGVVTQDNKLIAAGIYVAHGLDSHNYAYDLDLSPQEIVKAAQIDSVVVDADFRGNGLQRLICSELITIAAQKGYTKLTATASPNNPYSVNNFIALGFEIIKEKLKYGGLRRYILAKDLTHTNY